MKHICICFLLIILMAGCAPTSERTPVAKEIPVADTVNQKDNDLSDSIKISKKKEVVFPRIFDVVVSGFF
ncbi:MAG: hypothetical protein KAJ75_04920 [Alphaproteobacteria bacterium]|nr:hypothetical protein [Alphaproteobacteria bacterium]